MMKLIFKGAFAFQQLAAAAVLCEFLVWWLMVCVAGGWWRLRCSSLAMAALLIVSRLLG